MHAGFWHALRLWHTVIVDNRPEITDLLFTLNGHLPDHVFSKWIGAQSILPNDRRHVGAKPLVVLPLFLEAPPDLPFGLGVHNVDDDVSRLEKALYAIDGLDERIELVADPWKNRVARLLKIASGAIHARLRYEAFLQSRAPLCHQLFALLDSLRSI